MYKTWSNISLWRATAARANFPPVSGSGRMWLALLGVAAGIAAVGLWLGDGGARGAPIRVAFAGPTTGLSAEDGLAGVRAIELVFDRVNAAGGVAGRPLVLDVYDDQNDTERARANASVIADEGSTVAVIGHNFSTCSIAAGEVYAARGLPAIASAATNVAVTQDNRWYFRTIFNDRDQGQFIALYLKEVLKARRIGIVSETTAYGAYLRSVIEETAPELGLSVADAFSFDPASPGLAAQLQRIAGQASAPRAPDALVLAMQPEAGVALVKALRDASYPGDLIVSDALASQAFADGFRGFPRERSQPGFYTDGIYASTPFLFDTVGRRAGAFVQAYVARYDQSPVWYAAFAADAASTIVAALRRSGISPDENDISAARSALRDALAAIGPLDPVDGVTGPTFFDPVGDAEKPVPLGRFLGGELVSAFGQLRPLPGVRDAADLGDRYHPDRVVTLGDRILYRTDVARVGLVAERFDTIDFAHESFEFDFYIWFRHQGDRSVEDVVFTNAIEPIDLGEPIDEVVDEEGVYRVYRVHGAFRPDTVETDYGQHALGVSLHHRERTRDDLVLAIDSVGMKLGRQNGRSERGARARKLLGSHSHWTLSHVVFYESAVNEHALGHPSYLSGAGNARLFSQLTVAAIVRGQALSLRGLLPGRYQRGLLVLGVVGGFVLLVLPAGSPKLRWTLQAGFAFLVLLSAEPLLGNWLKTVQPLSLDELARTFDFLWWLVPAVFVNLAIDRFIWQPAEARGGRPMPTLLRWSIAFLVYLLASFGVVAFVYDYRLTGILATSGVVAMIIGLAVQLNITNLFAGVALNLERPFRVGDWIMVHGRTPDPSDGVTGKVVDINWRTTRLQTADDTLVVIPNGQISEKTLTNFMLPERSRFQLQFTIDQSVPAERAIEVMLGALKPLLEADDHPLLADPAPSVRISQVTENGVEYTVRYRILPSQISPNKARHRVNQAVVHALRAASIELAYPRRRVREEHVSLPPDPDQA